MTKKVLSIISLCTFIVGLLTACFVYAKEKKEYAKRVF